MKKTKLNKGEFFGRHLHPSVYKKIRKTKEMLKEGKIDPDDFEKNGGLNKQTRSYVEKQDKVNDEYLKQLRQECEQENSGPCEKMDPRKGTKKALVLLINFKDTDRNQLTEPEHYTEMLFSRSKPSMRNYFLEASGNQLTIDGDVSSQWYQAKNNASYYIDKNGNNNYPKARELVKEALILAKAKKFDFSKYAVDGKLELLIVIFSGAGFDTSLKPVDIRPHFNSLGELFQLEPGIGVDKYVINSELPKQDLGSFCHEVGHVLGLHDHYRDGYSPIVGGWCSMAVGCYNNNSETPALPCAYCKSSLGWVETELVKGKPKLYQIPEVVKNKKIYKLIVKDTNEEEYFLVENRQKKGFDSGLPANGLLIWHVDERVCLLKNNDPKRLFLTLKQADGLNDLEMDYCNLKGANKEKFENSILCGDKGDLYGYSNRTFDNKSNPNSNSQDGKNTGVSITSISGPGNVMTAVMGFKS
jgi:immune inhibitor A